MSDIVPVSVIVPVFNAEPFLSRCVESLINQSYKDLEIVLVNDGSTDNTGSLCDRYAAADSRIKVYHQNNAGPSVARNLGIELAKGKYLMFVDADDFVDTEIVRVLVEANEKNNAGLSVCAYQSHLVNGDMRYTSDRTEYEAERIPVEEFVSLKTFNIDDPRAVSKRAHIAGNIWGRLYSTETIKMNGLRFNAGLTRYEDVLFNLSYIGCIDEILYFNKDLYHYCVYSDHISLSDRVTKDKYGMINTSYNAVCQRYKERNIGYIQYFYSYIIVGYIVRLFQDGSPFTFKEALLEIKTVCSSNVYREVMKCYRRPKGASILIPFFLGIRLYFLASVMAKARMLKASLGNRPVRQWCFFGDNK